MNKPKMLFIDIETAGMISHHWGRWQQNISQKQVLEESYILSYAYKWGHERKTHVDGLINHEGAVVAHDDKCLMEGLWNVLDEADIVVGHYLNRFDIPEINRRFAVHGMTPPSPYKTLCTKAAAKKYFRFSSNRLGDLGEQLGVGGKLKHTGFEMWRDCFAGDTKAWSLMMRYNKQDVVLLEKVYLRLLPFMKNHPNMGVYVGENVCTNCGSSHVQRRGTTTTNVGVYQRLQCQDCGSWFKDSKRLEAPTTFRNIT